MSFRKRNSLQLKHGHNRRGLRTAAYSCFSNMHQRCENPKNIQWHDYGGRGITVCKRWSVFENFLSDMGEPPAGLMLDRIDNNGQYKPSNCRWANKSQQQRNTRANRAVTINGQTASMIEMAERYGIGYHQLRDRLDILGWTPEKAVSTPIGNQGRRY